jgi:hypothetical protein
MILYVLEVVLRRRSTWSTWRVSGPIEELQLPLARQRLEIDFYFQRVVASSVVTTRNESSRPPRGGRGIEPRRL